MGTSNRRINKKDLLIVRPKGRTEELMMYCKLLKYMRKQPAVVAGALYRKICKNEFLPFIKTSPWPWDEQLYYTLWHSEVYGWVVVSLNRLNDVKL